MIRKMAIAGLCTLLLAGCGGSAVETSSSEAPSVSASVSPTPSPTPTGPVVLAKAAAGKRYLAIVCPANDANLAFNAAVEKYEGEQLSSARLKAKTRAAARKAAAAQEEAARALTDDGYVWPKNVRKPLEGVALAMYDDAALLKVMAKKGSRWEDWTGASADHESSSKVRLRLGLAPRGGDC